MAGIGFELERLFDRKGVLKLCQAYIYAGVISVGPMLMYVFMLLGVALVSNIAGMSKPDGRVMNCMMTYSLLISLFVTSGFNMVITRYTSDRLYEKRYGEIMPSLYGSCSVMLMLEVILYGFFLRASNVPFAQGIICLWLAMVMTVVWIEMIYLMILRDYKLILIGFLTSLMAGFLLALILALLQMITIARLMGCVTISFGIMMVWYHSLLLRHFPKSKGSAFRFLRWIRRYPSLVFIGFFLCLGLYGHLCIMYFGPLHHQTMGLFYIAPMYDIPALFAFFSIIFTIISFFTSVEVRFYPKYKRYYGLFNERGSIRDIESAEDDMVNVLGHELLILAVKQLIVSIIAIVGGGFIMDLLPLGMTELGKDIFRILCVGYGLYAVANSVMLIMLYFEDYRGAFIGTGLFAMISVIITTVQMLEGDIVYYGLGFSVGAVVFLAFSTVRLFWTTNNLQYLLLRRYGYEES